MRLHMALLLLNKDCTLAVDRTFHKNQPITWLLELETPYQINVTCWTCTVIL